MKTILLFLQVLFQMAQKILYKLKDPLHLIPDNNDISSAPLAVWSGTVEST